jgi:hypothetical protein
LLSEFDGTQSRDQIENKIRQWIDAGEIQLQSAGGNQWAQIAGTIRQWIDAGEIQLQSARGEPLNPDSVSTALSSTLERLARLGLLTESMPQPNRSPLPAA